MRLRVLSGFVLNGGRLADVGSELEVGVDVNEAQARSLLFRGRVAPVEAAPAPPSSVEPATDPAASSGPAPDNPEGGGSE